MKNNLKGVCIYPINTCIFCGQVRPGVEIGSRRPKNLDSVLTILFSRMRLELNAGDLSSLLMSNKFFAKKGEIAWKGVLQNFSQSEHLSRNILKLSSIEAKKYAHKLIS